jgi:hypothetical protein
MRIEPRLNKRNLPPGLPHRMVATHEALYDIFPGASAFIPFIKYEKPNQLCSVRHYRRTRRFQPLSALTND